MADTKSQKITSGTPRTDLLPPLWVVAMILLALTIWVLYQLREMVVLLVVGYTLAYVTNPLVSAIERRGVKRIWGIAIVWSVALLIVTMLAVTALPTVFREFASLVSNLPQYIDRARERLPDVIERLNSFRGGGTAVDSINLARDPAAALQFLPEISGDTVKGILAGVFATLMKGYSVTLTLVNIALLPFIVFYLSIDFARIHSGALAMVPPSYRPKVAAIAGEIDRYVSGFVRGQIVVCTILFLLYALGLGMVGVELWLVLAVIAGFGNIVPYLGFLCGIVLSTVMALVSFGELHSVLLVWGIFAAVQFLEGTFITPRVLGKNVGLSPLLVLLAIFAGGSLLGLLGIFLAVPLAAAAMVIGRHGHSWLVRHIERQI